MNFCFLFLVGEQSSTDGTSNPETSTKEQTLNGMYYSFNLRTQRLK